MLQLEVFYAVLLNRCQTGHLRSVGSLLARLPNPRRSPMQRVDRPRPCRVLHSRSRRPSADRGPRATGGHGPSTIVAGGHCHLPRDDQLPTPPEGDCCGGFRHPARTVFGSLNGHQTTPLGRQNSAIDYKLQSAPHYNHRYKHTIMRTIKPQMYCKCINVQKPKDTTISNTKNAMA